MARPNPTPSVQAVARCGAGVRFVAAAAEALQALGRAEWAPVVLPEPRGRRTADAVYVIGTTMRGGTTMQPGCLSVLEPTPGASLRFVFHVWATAIGPREMDRIGERCRAALRCYMGDHGFKHIDQLVPADSLPEQIRLRDEGWRATGTVMRPNNPTEYIRFVKPVEEV